MTRAPLVRQRLIEELENAAFGSVADLFNEAGELIPLHKLDPEVARRVHGIEIAQRKKGRYPVETIIRMRYDKAEAIARLAAALGVGGNVGATYGDDEVITHGGFNK